MRAAAEDENIQLDVGLCTTGTSTSSGTPGTTFDICTVYSPSSSIAAQYIQSCYSNCTEGRR